MTAEPVRVLCIEDDPKVTRLTQSKLEQAGYVVESARDGETGLAMYDQTPFDVVLVDQSLPVMDGLEVIRSLAAREPRPAIIIVVTGGEEMAVLEALKVGASDYVVRDLQGEYLELLPVVVEGVLQQQRLVEERKQALADLLAQRQLFDSLAMVAYASTGYPTLEDTLQSIIDSTAALTGAERVSLFLLDPAGSVTYSILVGDYVVPSQQQRLAARVMDKGLAGWVARRREPALIHDTSKDERWLPPLDAPLVPRSALVVPILRADELVGIITLTHSTPGHFNEDYLQLMQAAAAQMALALHNAQLFEEQRRLVHRQSTLYEVLRAVGGHLDSRLVAETAVETIAQLTSWPTVALVLPRENEPYLMVQATAGRAPTAETWTLSPEQEIVRRALETGRTQYVPEGGSGLNQDFGHPGSELAVPSQRGEQVLGVLSLRSDDANAFDADDIRMAELLAETLALALDNARLYSAAQQEIAERKQTEEALRRAKDAAEAANRAKSSFLANMSHELRTPLNVIIGYSEMLQEELEGEDLATYVSDLEKIRSAGTRLFDLIKDILDFSRIEAGRVTLDLEQFDVASLVRELEVSVRPLIEKNANTLTIQQAEDIATMRADRAKLQQVLYNLLHNAAKFSENGTVTLHVSRETISDGRSWISFQVRDTGIGMTPEQMQDLFQPFTLVDDSVTRKHTGSGLGLAISWHFCRIMGGEISVKSQVGKGSTFTVRLPEEVELPPHVLPSDETGVAPLAEVAAYEAECPAERPCTVLIVDDEPDARDLITRYLVKEGFHVETAANGAEGLNQARALRPDIIILDVLMPDMDGWAVLAELRADPELAGIPVIMATVVDDKARGFALGASEYIIKPLDSKRLISVLRKYQRVMGHILIVEDDTATRELLRRSLEKEGWMVIEAEDGRIALERVAEFPPDIILLDLLLPEMDGFQFIAALRRNPAWQRIPIVVITAKDLSASDKEHLKAFVEHILHKGDYSREQLLQKTRDLVAACLQRRATGPGQ